ncbi:MAG TPA: hypothetical protein VHH55_04320 [Gaiellaceae bacterium]|jgi:hypothetical protein|nr:hypothetical protein [Gaiellaceae bacterium]
MHLYPQLPGPRNRALVADVSSILLLGLFAWAGLQVHEAVDRLAVLGEGVQATGGAVQGGFESAADAVDGTPIVGDDVADGLRGAGEGSGGEVSELGERGEEGAHDLANLLGLVTFALPALLLFNTWLPGRIAQVRKLRAASLVLDDSTEERRRLLAMRAAFSLPYGQLLQYTRDPLGDLEAGRYDALVAAALEDAGLKPA